MTTTIFRKPGVFRNQGASAPRPVGLPVRRPMCGFTRAAPTT